MNQPASRSLLANLTYQPKELLFGTSGRRGELVHLTQLEVYVNAMAELKYLQNLPPEDGGILTGDDFYFAYDLRPSSTAFASEYGGRGELAQAIALAISDAGMRPLNLGSLPTPALTYFALQQGKGSIMITGSHIPFDRNGYKLNTSAGELLKDHETPIGEAVKRERDRLYHEPFADSLFDSNGMLKGGHVELPSVLKSAREAYLKRYLSFFPAGYLEGMRLLVYQHSAVGRDLLVELLEQLGATVIPAGRSTEFVPIDTENIDSAQLAAIQELADTASAEHGALDAIVSTDGDSDRPLILGIDNGTVRFFGGDLVGMVAAEFLGADAVVVPISCNDAIDRSPLAPRLQAKTRIGSPYVIAGMQQAKREGKQVVCGWEANGGFLLGSDVDRDGPVLKALPTRDAFLPILCTLFSARRHAVTLPELFARISGRFSKAGLLKNFPRSVAVGMVARFSPADAAAQEFAFSDSEMESPIKEIRASLCRFFSRERGFGDITKLNYIDGVRITFESGEVAHLRPSGNADELRIYAVADSRERADEIVTAALAEPDGILRAMQRSCEES